MHRCATATPRSPPSPPLSWKSLGYTALWLPDVGGDVFGSVEALLAATSKAVVATGILNLWLHEPAETAEGFAAIEDAHPDRFLMGIGVSHGPFINQMEPGRYTKPLTKTLEYLDAIDAQPRPVPQSRRLLAALGPKMLELARTRAGGSHPYLANPDHTALARDVLGHGPLLAPEQPVVRERAPDTARTIARTHLAGYLTLPNYVDNLLRIGLRDDDVAGGGSDRLVDAVVAWGDDDAIAARVQQHRDAGADHVCIQVLTSTPFEFPLEQWRALAPALTPG